MSTNRPMLDVIVRRQPVALPPGTPVRDASLAMRDQRIGAVLVTDPEGRLLGIFTGRDAVSRVLAEGRDPATTPLEEVMTPRPQTLGPDARAIEALRLMQDCGCPHVPVTAGDRLLGIVSRGDFRAAELDRLEAESRLWEQL
jgi:CBS domain-containing protein